MTPNQQVLSDEQILRKRDTHVGGPTPSYPLDNSDWLDFARAIESATLAALAQQAQAPSVPHLFEFWWEAHMPQSTQAEAWSSWQSAQSSNNVAVGAQETVAMVCDLFPSTRTKLYELGFAPDAPLYTTPQPKPAPPAPAPVDERAAFKAELARMPEWEPDFKHHRAWVEPLLWTFWQARAILALRPQAVPMTPEVRQQWRFIRDRLNTPGMYQDRVGKFVEWFEAHHGITAKAEGVKP